MKKILSAIAISLASTWVVSFAYADCGDTGINCHVPGGLISDGSTITTIQVDVRNAAGATPNASGTFYFIEASQGAASNTPDNTNGTINYDVSQYLTSFAPSSSDDISANIDPVASGASPVTYNLYAKACPVNDPANGNCSAWALLGTIQTHQYPANPGFANVLPADAVTNQVTLRNSSVQDSQDVKTWQLQLTNLDSDLGGSSATLFKNSPEDGSGTGFFTVTNGNYANLLPNREYSATQNLIYKFTIPGPSSTTSPFYTQPATPQAPAAVVSNGRFSVTVNFTASTSNHAGTSYQVFIHQGSGLGGTVVTSSAYITLNPGQTSANIKVSGLTPDPVNPLTFTASVKAINEGNIPTDHLWLNSTEFQIGTFVVQPFQVSFTFNSITQTSANALMQLNDGSGVDHFRILLNGTDLGPTAWTGGSSAPATQNYSLSSLTPNKQQSIQAKICESPTGDDSECSGFLPTSAATFYTLPFAPANPSGFGTPTTTSIVVNWTDASANATPGTTYHLQYSAVGASGPWTDFASNPSKVGGASQSGTITGLSSFVTYWAQVKTVSASGDSAFDSAYLPITGSVQTHDTPVTLSAIMATVYSSSMSLTVSAGGGIAPYQYHWSVSPSAGTSFTANDDVSAGADNTFMLYNTITAYTITVTATDNGGAGPGADTKTLNITPGQTASRIDVSPTSAIVGRGQPKTFNATVFDQQAIPAVIPGAAVTWSVPGAAGSVGSPNPAPSTVYTAGNTVGNYTLTSVTGSVSTTTAITVRANPVVVNPTSPLNIGTGGTQPFTAAVTNPLGGAISPTITWSVSACNAANTIDASGLFHANVADATACTITATTQYGDTGTSHITVDNTLPQITVTPTATVFVTTATLSVSGTGFNGPSNLTYTWSLVSPITSTVTFTNNNGTTSGNNVTVTFTAVGTYVFKATLTDTATTNPDGSHPSNSANTGNVVVNSVLTSITVTPNNITVQALSAQQFMANGFDQFSNATSAGSVNWSTQGGGSISGAGSFSSPSLGQNILITAFRFNSLNQRVAGTTNVNVISFDVSGAYAYPVPYKSTFQKQTITFTGLGSNSQIRIYTTSGHEVFSINLSQNSYDWNVRNNSGDKLASGVYFYFVESPAGKKDGKLIIIQ